jgi:Na+-translocating ferredoxin:NAD+ oxidoreductase subunit E
MSDAKEGFIPNTLLSGLVGICPLIAAAKSLAEGLVYGLGVALCAVALGAIVPVLRGVVADRLRVPATLALSAALALSYALCVGIYSPTIAAGLWIYLPLLAVSGLSLSVLRRTHVNGGLGPEGRSHFGPILLEAFMFLLTAAFVGGLREIVGLGTLTLPTPGLSLARVAIADFAPLPMLVSPAGGFILLGFIVAAYRSLVRTGGRRST